MSPTALALLSALPWILVPVVSGIRSRRSRSITEFSETPPSDPPLVSVIIPARNEAANIERCLRSILATTYPRIEVIVVDDQSTDSTGDIATAVARTDPRVLVFTTPDLPSDWFGKQWACATGAAKAKGELLCFTDADTTHSPDLLTRSVNAMRAREADLFTVMGRQEMVTFWEKLVQVQVFAMLHFWYGGTEDVNRARHAWRKIANGQYLLMTRAAYDDIGGHSAVRHTVAEDLMLAQRFHRLGKRVVFMEGFDQLSTRMYTSLRGLIEGWGKNVYAGGIHALPPGRFWRLTFPFGLLTMPLFVLTPAVLLLAGALGLTSLGVLLWSIVAAAAILLWWTVIYLDLELSPVYALFYPVGAVLTIYIFLGAIVRGQRVTWKGRSYTAN